MNNLGLEKEQRVETYKQAMVGTLDEHKFFALLSSYIKESIQEEKVLIFKVSNEGQIQLLADSGVEKKSGKWFSEAGLISYVAKMKVAYFSNAVERDPLFNKDIYSYSIKRECVIPIIVENNLIAIVALQSTAVEGQYSHDLVLKVLESLLPFKASLINMQMYLVIKNLNEHLLKKIQQNSDRKMGQKGIEQFVHIEESIEKKQLITQSPLFQEVINKLERKALLNNIIVMRGEEGVGKRLLAKHIHSLNFTQKMVPFATLDFNGLVNSDLMSEMNPQMIYQMAKELRELIGNGTLYIEYKDQVSPAQEHFLLLLIKELDQAHHVRPIVLAISHYSTLSAHLQNAVSDLVEIPVLKERQEDILPLAQLYLREMTFPGEAEKIISEMGQKLLLKYPWPRNVDEIKDFMTCANLMSEKPVIDVQHLPEVLRYAEISKTNRTEKNDGSSPLYAGRNIVGELVSTNSVSNERIPTMGALSSVEENAQEIRLSAGDDMTLATMEKIYITSVLHRLNGNKTRAAKALGITVKTLYNKLHLYGMV